MNTTSHHASTAPAAGQLLLVGPREAMGAEILARLQRDGYQITTVDAGDPRALQAAVEAAVHGVMQATPDIAVLVVNTPVARAGLSFDQVDDAAFEAAFEHQLLDVVAAAQAVLSHMRAGARIVHVGARGHLGAWGGVHQMAASAALVAMTRSMALELEPEGICVNLVAGEFTRERLDTARNRAAVANAVSYLASADAGVTGQTLLVDGQAALRMAESRRPRNPSTPGLAPGPTPALEPGADSA